MPADSDLPPGRQDDDAATGSANPEDSRASEASTRSFIDVAGGRTGQPDTILTPDSPLEHLGQYRIKRLIASGGMGSVYLAQQESPRRTVALKVMRKGIASRSALRRFEFESQILARLRHPNIAQVYESGTHDDGSGGVPFFAMEYVPNAKTLTQFASSRKLGTKQRLQLFIKVCQAVHHGHQKGIIHRDLKPGNILVDSTGEPKIIDFGVARATDSDLAVTTLQTDVGQLIGTLQYMSPEQCDADPHDLDTRSDVYSLGVVLYELLTEQLPYDVTRVALHEAARVIKENEPAKPSTINRTLRGDVETIALKAMEKERERRYMSAEAFGEDIRRYLNDEPITARPASAMYLMQRFARRHRGAVIAGVTIAAALIAATVVSVAFAFIAERERAKTELTLRQRDDALAAEARRAEELEQVAQFQQQQLGGVDAESMGLELRDGLREKIAALSARRGLDEAAAATTLDDYDAMVAGADFTGLALQTLEHEIFAPALEAIDRQFADQPLVRARLLQTLADILQDAGLLDLASQPQFEALEIFRAELGDDELTTMSSIVSMGNLLESQGKLTEAEPYFREALERYRRTLGDDHRFTLVSIYNLGLLLQLQGKFTDAEPYYREALERRRRTLGDDHPDTLSSIGSIGGLLQSQGMLSEAEPHFREALEGQRRTLGDDHQRTLTSIHNLGRLLQSQGKLTEAEPYLSEALEGRRRTLGDDHLYTLDSIDNMGLLLQTQGRLNEAEPFWSEALEGRRRTLGDDHPGTLASINNMGTLLFSQGNLDGAEPYLREALEGRRRMLGDDHPGTLYSINNLGFLLQSQGKFDEAEPYYREALDNSRRKLGDDHPRTLILINNMGSLLFEMDRLEQAEALGAEAVDGGRAKLPSGHWYMGLFLSQHAKTLAKMERFSESEARHLEAYAILEAALGTSHVHTQGVVGLLVELYDAWHAAEPEAGHDAKAAEWRARLPADDAD